MQKTIKTLSMSALGFLLTACTSQTPTLTDSERFKQGKNDGCATAKGIYTKNSKAFIGNSDYQDGWFYGRKHCNS